MKIAVIGTGYVGLVTGACFADSGNDVTCVDIDQEKIAGLRQGKIPIFEPGLSELVLKNAAAGRLHFTTDLAASVEPAELVFLAVGTPPAADGSADLTALFAVVDTMAPHLQSYAVIVTKSTVPVGTNAQIAARLKVQTGRDCDIASNPEFLKEGAAIDDFMRPDRVVVGVRRAAVADVMQRLYAPFLRTEHPLLIMSPESAELTKYVANAMLSTKISFINEMANLCERMGGDINDVRRGIGHDTRIGFSFLFPGVGYGGSCFPKDVRALAAMARACGVTPRMLEAVDQTNQAQKQVLAERIEQHFAAALPGRTIAVWGIAFKPRTDDIREAPAIALIQRLLNKGVHLRVFDPEAMANAQREFAHQITYADSPLDTLDGADALAILTEWGDFRSPDFNEIHRRLTQPVIFDGRNLYQPDDMRRLGFTYYSIGRPAVVPDVTDTSKLPHQDVGEKP
jgi:UDPglucose 6-dehydrogenase